MTPHTLSDCQVLDQHDPLRSLRDLFQLPEGVIYLDGNSLGVLPKETPARVAQAVAQEWGNDLIKSWNTAGWFQMPLKVGNKIARLIGAKDHEVVAADSTSINLFKVLSAALSIAKADQPEKNIILSERTNFPTDLYIAEALCKERGYQLKLVEAEELHAALQENVAVLMLTHVNYRTGAMLNLKDLTAAAHAVGALAIWDLAHSAGAVPVDLNGASADFAVGCGYKYLNGGPGAPAFVWVNPKHTNRFWQPLSGWWGHAAPFEFTPDYQPAAGIARYQCGTQAILSLTALDTGLDAFLEAEKLGGMTALRQKSLALTSLFMQLVKTQLAGHGFGIATPEKLEIRGSQVSLTRTEGAYAIVQALIARGVIGDFRAGDGKQHPDILRFGLTPLYLGYADVWHAVRHLREVMETQEWQQERFSQKQAVT
ncbi:kynureninase [Limnohabitans sp. MMS-10A-178]|uniref:kynureninase n=1 Tax=Limnohabitans sp. MMS-10A-178 TaxID=1835767 RepID=UPI000D3C1E29|nr:kynureninase [Limnohabitans sp. MMS-10A-178]PUE16779.1 kynureninase [Limnohabitans sp. MMS-10A-178]